MKSLLPFVAVLTAGLIATIALCVGGAYLAGRASCNQLAAQTGHPTSFHFVSGCYVNLPNVGWVPRSAWRGVDGGE